MALRQLYRALTSLSNGNSQTAVEATQLLYFLNLSYRNKVRAENGRGGEEKGESGGQDVDVAAAVEFMQRQRIIKDAGGGGGGVEGVGAAANSAAHMAAAEVALGELSIDDICDVLRDVLTVPPDMVSE